MTFNLYQTASGRWTFVVFNNAGADVLSGAYYDTEADAKKVIDSYINTLHSRELPRRRL